MILQGKKGLIMGVANKKSLAWAIAQHCKQHGAQLAFSYQNEILLNRLKPLAESVDSNMLFECDVSNDVSIDNMFAQIEQSFGKIDFLVHSIAFTNRETLKGRYIDTKREHFQEALDISCYSFVACAKRAAQIMDSGSIITLTYYGGEKVIPNYNVMGVAKAALEASVRYMALDLGSKDIRVNALSSGPVKTLASSVIGDFNSFLKWTENNSPLKRNTNFSDLGNNAVYLLSDLSSGVTGEVLHVDSGYHIMGMKIPENN